MSLSLSSLFISILRLFVFLSFSSTHHQPKPKKLLGLFEVVKSYSVNKAYYLGRISHLSSGLFIVGCLFPDLSLCKAYISQQFI